MFNRISDFEKKLERYSAVSLHFKKPFYQWIRSIVEYDPIGRSYERLAASIEPIVWITKSTGSFKSGEHYEEYIASIKNGMMVSEFRGLCSDESRWPELTSEVFDQYFELVVYDHVASAKYLH